MENANEFSDFYQGNKCIWMEADVVAYKLCDQNYDCERCPFDFVMRNTWREKTESDRIMLNFANNSVIDKIIGKISRIIYDGKLIYLENQLELKNIFGSVYTIGISRLLSNLFEEIEEIELLKSYGMVKKNEKLLRLSGKWGKREIISPMNFVLLQKLDLNPDNLPDDNMFAVISAYDMEVSYEKISIDTIRERNFKLLKKLHGFLKAEPEIGYTMMDGGKKCEFLYEVLGQEAFHKLISELA
jgi:hypothetical protein